MKPPFIRYPDGTVRQGEVVKAGEDWDVEIDPGDLTFLRIDHQTRLQFDDTEVVIESPFVLQVAGVEYRLDPGERVELGPLLALYPDALVSAWVESTGALHLVFVSGASITVPPDSHYEAWQVNGAGGYLAVCSPGGSGRIALWRQQSSWGGARPRSGQPE